MTKILAALPGPNSVIFCALEKIDDKIKQISITQEVVKLNNQDENTILQTVSEITDAHMAEHDFDKVVIAKAGTSPQGKGASPTRLKIEAAIQLSAMNASIEPALISPQTVAAYEKKQTDSTENIIGATFSSSDKKRVALVGLLGLEK